MSSNAIVNVKKPTNNQDADASPTNELNASAALNGTTLEKTDAGGTKSVDLSSLASSGGGTYQKFTQTIDSDMLPAESTSDYYANAATTQRQNQVSFGMMQGTMQD